MSNADAKLQVQTELADAWWRAQRLVWHCKAWEATMLLIDDLERRLGLLDRMAFTD